MASAVPQSPSGPEGLTDAEMMLRVKAGDDSAFDYLVQKYRRAMINFMYRMAHNSAAAEDLAQEVFLRVYKHLRRFDERRDFAPWLYRIAVNVCRDIARKRGREATLDESARAVQSADSAQAEQRRMLMRALQELPAKERAALVLRDLEGLTTAEVATILGSSESTVRSQISTARVKIRKFIDRNFGSRT